VRSRFSSAQLLDGSVILDESRELADTDADGWVGIGLMIELFGGEWL
jgi:hypothetical protein